MKYLLAIYLLVSPRLALSQDIFFIVSDKISQKNIELKEIKDFFLKKKKYWDDGKRARPIGQSLGTPAREAFLKLILQKSEIEMSEYWIEQKQVNGLVRPIQLENNEMVIQLVKSMPGSIGYIFVDNIESIDNNELKIIKASVQ